MSLKRWLLLALGVAVGTHLMTLFATPYVMMGGVHLIARLNDGHGHLQIFPKVQAGKDVVVRSSPDLLYSACPFDLSKGNYEIQAPPTDSYTSVSMFAYNTDNFFAQNDLDSPDGIHLVLAKPERQVTVPEGATLVKSETPYGLILFRYYVADKQVVELDAIRAKATCRLLST
ncbi:MAG: DUF1254 domain-containing protein [Pseudomonadota bacterium]